MNFTNFYPKWKGEGLRLGACLSHDLPLSETTSFPFDYVASYARSALDGSSILYGGELGLFETLEDNILLLNNIYLEMKNPPALDTGNPLWYAVENYPDVKGYNWGISEVQKGIFNEWELENLQAILGSDEGIEAQFLLLQFELYAPENSFAVRILDGNNHLENKAKCFLACFLNKDRWVCSYFSGREYKTLKQVADKMLTLRNNKKVEIMKLYNYINENYTNEELGRSY